MNGAVEEQCGRDVRLPFRLFPVLADTGVDGERDVYWHGAFHQLAHSG